MNNRRFRLVAWVFATVVPLAGLQQAVARDCNRNGVPDHCDVDCSPPGCLQYACGRSDDIDGNGIPDECEGAPAIGMFSSTVDFTALGTLINLDDSVPGRLSRSELPSPMPNLWVAASARGTIVRINTEPGPALGDVVGEYFTAPDGRGKNPSRTSVNLDGEVWVSNRSEGSQLGKGSITRIGVLDGGTLIPPTACEPDNRATFAPPFAYNTCVDRNGDGMITTSNGLIPLPWHHEDPLDFGTVDTAEDERIISYVELNAQNARHISVNKYNDVWVGGSQNNNTFDLVDGETGAILKTFDVGTGGYGGLIDCNGVLWSVSRSGDPGLFRYDTNFGIDDIECCDLVIRIDSNSDGVIDDNDAPDGNLASMFIPINYDDDDFDGTPDFENEYPVIGEDNLREVQLFVPCHVETPGSWWSVSWIDPDPDGNADTETIRVWRYPDKSDGDEINPVLGQPLVNGELHYDEWPPPAPLWIEAGDVADEIEISFTIHIEPLQAGRAPVQKTKTIKTHSACKWARVNVGGNASWRSAPNSPPLEIVSGAKATISTHQVQLCAESLQGQRDVPAGSSAWVGVIWRVGNTATLWAQLGYSRRRHAASLGHPGAPMPLSKRFCETRSGPDDSKPSDYDVFYFPFPTGANTHTYNCELENASGKWKFLYDSTPGVMTEFYSSPPPTWATWVHPKKGNFIDWMAEVWNEDDQMVGSLSVPCIYSGLAVRFESDNFYTPVSIPSSFLTNQAPARFGVDLVNPVNGVSNTMKVWDKFP